MILLLESLHGDAEAELTAFGRVIRAETPDGSLDCGAHELGAVRAILTRGRGRIDVALMDRCPALEVIARAGAGLDNLDTLAAKERGIQVIHAPGVNARTVAEHTIALLLDLSRRISEWGRRVRDGEWEERANYGGQELHGQTLGILGFGRIGRRVATLAKAFGMQVLVGASVEGDGGRDPRVPLGELLPQVDALSLHLPLTQATQGLIGPDEFASLRPGAVLVNTARGGLVDGGSLRSALRSGHLGGYGADVLESEPPFPKDPLLRFPNVVITPHVASLTSATYRELCLSTVKNVLEVLRGEGPDPNSVFHP